MSAESSEVDPQRKEFEKAKIAYLKILDDELVQLYRLIEEQAADEKIENICWKILRSAEGKLLRTKTGNENGEIVNQGWEHYWDLDEHLSWGGPVGFGDIRHDLVAKHRYTAFVEMIRLVKWTEGRHGIETSKRPRGKRKQKAQLSESVLDYLDSRGIEIQDNWQPSPRSAASPLEAENSLYLVGEIWHFFYQGEHGQFPKKGNQCIEWLAKMLRTPNKFLSVADILNDPEGRLEGDATLSGQQLADSQWFNDIRKRVTDIDEAVALHGWTKDLADEYNTLMNLLKEANATKQLTSTLDRAHHNIATQIRTFRKKLANHMPKLAAHLAILKFDFPDFGYFPPTDSPSWKI
jgi:hypothetical protein